MTEQNRVEAPVKAEAEKRRAMNFWDKLWLPPKFHGYRVLAVIAAMLIWIYVVISQNTLADTMYMVPLEYRNISSELALLETTNQVQVRVQGSSAQLDQMNSGGISAYLDLADVKAGSTSLGVHVTVPEGVQLISVTPGTVSVTLEKLSAASYPLTVKTIGNPEEGYTLLDAVSLPDTVMLSAAEEYIGTVGSVQVTADVDGLSENYDKNLQVQVLDHSGNNITDKFTVSPSTAEVVIPVVFSQPEKSVAVNASILGEPAEGYQVSRIVVEPSTMRVFGDLDRLRSLYYLETEPIDISGLNKTYSRTVNIVCDSDLTLSQSTVTVVVQIEPVSTASFTRTLIYGQNLASGLSCDLSGHSLKISVTGPRTDIGDIGSNEIIPYVDCSGITEAGTYTLPLSATLPANISLVAIDPAQITFTVTAAE